jgi:hypothetical protein
MSLYEAYFVPELTDPYGLELPGPNYPIAPKWPPDPKDVACNAKEAQRKQPKGWLESKGKGNFKPGTTKCNKFVCDICDSANCPVPYIRGRGKQYGVPTSPPLAHDFANPNVPLGSWKVIGTISGRSMGNYPLEPGDIIAQAGDINQEGGTGHVGIYVGDGQVASSAYIPDDPNSGIITLSDWGFRSSQSDDTFTIRRYNP